MEGPIPAKDLYPPIDAHATGTLDVGDGHVMYWDCSGNPDGVPVVLFHGGPGAGCAPIHRRFFDPDHFRIILFDQRGCGLSTPFGETAANTTDHLINDIEALRRHLGVEDWFVFGGSWGATLALAYGQAHPDRCRGFVLRGVFLGTADEMDWFLTGMGRFFPQAWQAFTEHVGETSPQALIAAYWDRLNDPDPSVAQAAAESWAGYETACARLLPTNSEPGGTWAVALTRMEVHYFRHAMFLDEGQLLNTLSRIDHLPAIIVQGRYDVICPPKTANALADAWPNATLVMVPDAGHAALESGIRSALIRATDHFRCPPEKP